MPDGDDPLWRELSAVPSLALSSFTTSSMYFAPVVAAPAAPSSPERTWRILLAYRASREARFAESDCIASSCSPTLCHTESLTCSIFRLVCAFDIFISENTS